MQIKKFTDFELRPAGTQLIIQVYKSLGSFPKVQLCGFVDQGKDLVLSIAVTIAKGFGRFHLHKRNNFHNHTPPRHQTKLTLIYQFQSV